MSAGDAAMALALGVTAGVYSGLLGVGGGILMVPGMVLLLSQGQHVAEGTSLLVIVPTAMAGTRAAFRRGLVDRAAAAWIAAGGILGAAGGSVLAVHVIADEKLLRRLFGGVILAVAVRLAVPGRRGVPPVTPPAP